MGTVAEYESKFDMLINQVTGISEGLLKAFYISGLKPALQCALLTSNPTTLGEAFSLARATEARFAKDALSKLLQRGTVAEYQNEFEMLINRVTGISESLLTTIYISGLKVALQIDYLTKFESKCFILNTKDYLTKFDPKSYEGVFLGYSQNSKAYIILNKHTRKVEESLNVTFNETPPPSKTSHLVDDDLDEEEAIKVTKKKNLENDIVD
ncbi:retrovirus-related pol polyprotein from transposon TNT 1-94, partial [Tanacetum coccineum]